MRDTNKETKAKENYNIIITTTNNNYNTMPWRRRRSQEIKL